MPTNSRRNLADWLPVIAAAYMTIPEAWTKPLRIGPVSVMNVLFVLCLLASLRGIRARSGGLWIGCASAALVYMGVRGIANRGGEYFDWKVYLADLLTFGGAIAGMLWARRMHVTQLARMARVLAIVTIGCLLMDWACLNLGLVKPSWEGPRVFVFSMFFGTWWLMALTPVILATEGLGTGLLSVKASRALLTAVIVVMVAVAVTSGTRSVAFELLACIALCAPLILRNFRTAYAAIILAILVGLASSVVLPHIADFRFFANRFAETDLASEQRYAELRMMMDQLMPHIVIGEGFGSSFVSPVVVDGSNLAVAPHVGILTVLFKGGFVVFGVAIVVPLAVAVFSMATNRNRPHSYGCMAGAALYAIAASLSGGWGFFHLFLASLMLSAGVALAKAPLRNLNPIDLKVLAGILDRLRASESAAVS